MVKFQIVVAAVFLGLALGIWAAFLRPVPVRTARGVIRGKSFEAAGEYVQYQPGNRAGFYTPTTIPTSEHFVLRIQVDGQPKEIGYALNTVAAGAFQVGQPVRVDYQERGVPPFWHRIYITSVQPGD